MSINEYSRQYSRGGRPHPTPALSAATSNVLQYHGGPLLRDHDRRGVGVSRNQRRHDRRIDHPQTREAAHAQTLVDYRAGILPHAAGADRMVHRRTPPADVI